MYIGFKVESGFSGISFARFLHLCSQLPSYNSLAKHLAPHLEVCIWTPELYPILEGEILMNVLNFKTQFVCIAEILYVVLTMMASFDENANGTVSGQVFELVVQESFLRSNICSLGK